LRELKKKEVKPVSTKEIAAMAGVTYSTAAAAKNRGRALFNAVLPDGLIDANHPSTIEYVASRRLLKKDFKGDLKKEKVFNESYGDLALQYLSDLDKKNATNFLDFSLRDIVQKFGGNPLFEKWLKSVKSIEEIREKQIKNNETLESLIPRDFVRQHIFSLIEIANVRLINDTPKTIVSRLLESIKSGDKREELEQQVRELISAQIKGIKLAARRKLGND